jgi:hypothetical protein
MDTTKILRFHFNNLWDNPGLRFDDSITYINQEFSDKEKFFIANKFSNGFISLLTSNSLHALDVKMLSSIDAMEELNTSVNLSFMYLYKSSFDSLRRALEITVIGQYFELIKNNIDSVFDWFNSKSNTPMFSKMIKELIMDQNFKEIDSRFNWTKNISKHYWNLCDFSHTKGHDKSIISLNKKSIFKPEINKEALQSFLTNYISTLEHIAIIYSIQNPILIIGLPIYEKFGNSGNHGFFSEDQAMNLRNLLPKEYLEYIQQLTEFEIIKYKIKEIKTLPDSESYIKMMELLDSFNK